MANVTDTAKFRKASREYKKVCEEFMDFVHAYPAEVWYTRRGIEIINKETVFEYNLLLKKLDSKKEILDIATKRLSSKSQYRPLRAA